MLRTKKRMTRNVLAILLALTLIFSMSATAFADEIPVGGTQAEAADPGTEEVLPPEGDGQEPADDEDLPPEEETAADEDGIIEETLEGEDAEEEAEEAEEAYAFPGMPGNYALSSEERADKAALREEGVVKSFDTTIAGEDYIEGEVIFLTESPEYAETVAEAYGGGIESFENGVAVVALPDEATTCDAISAAADLGNNMPAVYPNFIYTLPAPVLSEEMRVSDQDIRAFVDAPKKKNWSSYVFNDPYLKNPNAGSFGYQWFHDVIGTYAAWGTTMGAGVTVAVLDTGVQSTHPDLNLTTTGTNTTVSPSTTVTNDVKGHGTHVAGIIAAKANTVGGRGVAPEATLIPVKVLKDDGQDVGQGTTGSIASGVNWVINASGTRRADVINMSLGGYGIDKGLQKVVTNAIAKGIVVVAAAGNDSTNNRCTPADYPNVICVASSDMNNMRSNFSNYGPQITIAAPGSEIISTYPTGTPNPSDRNHIANGYYVMGGTSMAAPMVSGAAALYISKLSKKPASKADVVKVKNALVKNATTAASPKIGKILNVGNMFNSIKPKPTFTVKNSGGTAYADIKSPIPNNGRVTITGSNFLVYTTDGTTPSVKNAEVANGQIPPGTATNTIDVQLNTLPIGKVTIKALDVNGQGAVSAVATLTITTIAPPGASGMSAITGPLILAAGKSGTYTAKVTAAAPAGTSKTVEWSVNDTTKASMDKKTGKLTIKAGAGGTVIVRAQAKGAPAVAATLTVTISAFPIASLSIAGGGATLFGNGAGTAPPYPKTCTLTPQGSFANGAIIGSFTNYVSWSTSNAKIATVSTAGVVTAVGSGKVTITLKATDGSGKSVKATVNCIMRTTAVTISGSNGRIATGGELTLKAATTPVKPTKAGVNWKVDPTSPAGVKIDSKGKLTVPKSVTAGTVKITATAKDGYGAVASVSLPVFPAAKTVKIESSESFGRTTTASSGNIATIQLFTLNPYTATDFDRARSGASAPASAVNETTIKLRANVDTGSTDTPWVVWSSSNTKVATVSTTGSITAKSVGKATITCTALDGSKKKASSKVNVGVPASSMWVQGKRANTTYSNPSLAFGKSLQMAAKPGSAYGKVTNTKVNWSCQVYRVNSSGVYYTPASLAINSKAMISSSGKVTVKSGIQNDWAISIGMDELAVKVTATAKDGSGVVGTQYVDLCPGTNRMKLNYAGYNSYVRKFDYVWWDGHDDYWLMLYSETYKSGGKNYLDGNYYSDYIVTSSNPKVVAIYGYGYEGLHSGHYYDYVGLIPLKKGTSTIKIVSNDGTGKSTSIKVIVNQWNQILGFK